MKICLIVDDYMPHSIKVAAKMMHELSVEYVQNGHKVSVITPDTNSSKSLTIDSLDGVDIYRFKSGEIKNVNKIKRAINETLLSYNAWKNCKSFLINNPHDIIIYYSPSIFFGAFVKKLKKLWNCKSYLILRDIFPQWTIDNNILKENSIITKYFRYFEKLNYDAADRIGLMSYKNKQWFDNYYRNNKSETLHNWTKSTNLEKKFNKYRKKFNLEDKIIYFYGGNIGHAQDMMNIFRLALKMKDHKKAHFLIVGAGDEYDLLKKEINTNNLKNITLMPSVNQKEFRQILSEIDVGLFTLNQYHKTHNFPGKILGYMNESIAILGSINKGNDLKEIIEEYNAGYISINPDDDKLYADAISLFDKEQRETIGANAKRLLEDKFCVKSISNNILKSLMNKYEN